MNKTQKGAWFCLITGTLFLTYITLIEMFPGGGTWNKLVKGLSLLLIFFMGMSAVWLRIKQSPTEVDSDERDKFIKKRAMFASYFSLFWFFIATCTIPWLIVGPEGSIPVCVLPVILLGVFIIVMLVYSVAILIQYGRRGKENE